MFLVVLRVKWCAALSSVVLHEVPEGQENRFNANVVEPCILGLVMTFRQPYCKNSLRKRFLEYFMLKIDGVKPEFAQETFDNFRVFRSVMSQHLTKNEKFPNRPKLVPESSRVCF